MQRVQKQILSNHDCFSTLPSDALELHNTLLDELREHYKPDWLTAIREDIAYYADVELPMPPFVNDLCEGEIGQNPYCFS